MPDNENQLPEHDDDPRIEQALRLGELRAQVDAATDGEFIEVIGEDVSMDAQEQFWQHVLAYESAPEGTLFVQLKERCGLRPTKPTELESDAAVHEALWELIRALAELRVFLYDTNHLSDRDLYQLLYDETLPEERTIMPPESGWNCRIGISEYPTPEFPEPSDTYLAYFAKDEERQRWLDDFPETPLPPKRMPICHRDHLLPIPPEEQTN
ncbi:hypothetical protein [Cerasicoccus frondis]|uniref:hypothetical protein n=1 Tax=Cerasicoccus frondis TaxID=490090 RepID=UPI0028525A3C|nr:hypothetical protein [Cerasicoccus frondis]